MFHANPVLNRLSKVNERAEGNTATYAGIASKTTFFLAITVLGMIAQLLVRAALASEPVWQSFELFEKFTVTLGRTETMVMVGVTVIGFIAELLGIFARRTIPVTGSIYSACQGYVISFIVFSVLKGYEYLGLEALLITVAVIAAGEKYRAVMLTLVLGSIALGLLSFIGSLIPATRPFVQAMTQNPVIAIGLDVFGILIAALFLISDFSIIDTCVREGYDKKYEWSAAFGLVFTVLWLYMKILDLLIQLNGKDKD